MRHSRSLLLSFAAATAACVPGNNAIYLTHTPASKFDPMTFACTTDDMVDIYRGRMDVNGSGQYYLNMKYVSELQVPSIKDGDGIERGNPNLNDFVAEDVLSTYLLAAISGVTFDPERPPVSGVIH